MVSGHVARYYSPVTIISHLFGAHLLRLDLGTHAGTGRMQPDRLKDLYDFGASTWPSAKEVQS